MRISKQQLKRIIREEYSSLLKENRHGDYGDKGPRRAPIATYGQQLIDARRGNREPPPSSNWHAFAKAMDIGVLDLDEVAEGLGMRNFDQLDAAISPRGLSDSQAFELIEIMYSINGSNETAVFDAMDLPYGR